MSQAHSKYYLIYDTNKDIWYENVFSLAAFCNEHGLYEASMRDVAKGRQKYQHRGFYCQERNETSKEIILNKIKEKKYIELAARFKKIKKPFDKKKRYNQSDKRIHFLDNVKFYYDEYHINEKKSCREIAELVDSDDETVRQCFKTLGLERINHYTFSYHSKGEEEVRDYLESIVNRHFKSDRKVLEGLEIDVYNDEMKFGVEYCGLYWHSELHKDKMYHYDKWRCCADKNVSLITIFENEWSNRNAQVKGFLKAKLGLFKRRIFARNCYIKTISKEDAKTFLEEYHIQDYKSALYCFGLYYNDVLLGVVTYGLHHRQAGIVLNRLAFKTDYQVVGGASKLIKNSIDMIETDTIITWSDNRWSDGKIYEKCGFIFDGDLNFDYYYTDFKKLVSKQSMKKNNSGCPEDKTEHQFAQENGLFRIYDCGKKRWKYRKEK